MRALRKIILISAFALFGIGVNAQAYQYLNVTKSDASEVSMTAAGLKITFSDGNLVAVSGGESHTISLSEISFLQFSDTAAVALTGDVNIDKAVDITDVVGLANHVLGATPSVFYVANADVNGDGEIDVTDVVNLANQVMGM